ncbi:hypothetical protein D3C85_1058220 [compost metagenome]
MVTKRHSSGVAVLFHKLTIVLTQALTDVLPAFFAGWTQRLNQALGNETNHHLWIHHHPRCDIQRIGQAVDDACRVVRMQGRQYKAAALTFTDTGAGRPAVANFTDDLGVRIKTLKRRQATLPGTSYRVRIVTVSEDCGLNGTVHLAFNRIFNGHQSPAATGQFQIHLTEGTHGGAFA